MQSYEKKIEYSIPHEIHVYYSKILPTRLHCFRNSHRRKARASIRPLVSASSHSYGLPLSFSKLHQSLFCRFNLRQEQRTLIKYHIVVQRQNRQVNIRFYFLFGAAENLGNPLRVVRVPSCHLNQIRLCLISVFLRHTYADEKMHNRRQFIRKSAEMVHHIGNIFDIFKGNAERTLLNTGNRFFSTCQNHFFFCIEVIIDTTVLQIVCIAEICGGCYRQPFFNKAVKAYTNDILRPLSLF